MPDPTTETTPDENKPSQPDNGNQPQSLSQVEAIVHKGLDIAEAGIELGVNIVSRLGLILKNQLVDNTNNVSQAYPTEECAQNETSSTVTDATEEYYLINRLALHPGDSVSISFSMNNDSLTDEKTISLSPIDFKGAEHHVVIPESNFSISPASKTIAPIDFEKFILTGTLPADIPADTYYGSIIVEDQTQHKISAVIVVTAANA